MKDFFFKYKNWQYKNTILLILSLILLYFLADTHIVKNVINKIGDFGYFGAFLTGIFFVSIFTVAPAILVLYNLADKLNPLEVALLAGMGAVVGDYLIFRLFKDKVVKEWKLLFAQIPWSKFFLNLFRTPFFSWLIPLVGAAIIASPLPDELGVGVLGVTKIKNWQFALISFILNAVGIFIVVAIARTF